MRPPARALRRAVYAALAAVLCWLPSPLLAHKPSDSYLTLKAADGAITGQWDIALRDLDHAIDSRASAYAATMPNSRVRTVVLPETIRELTRDRPKLFVPAKTPW